MTNFKSIEELLRMLSREKALLKDMFQNRKSISYSYEMAREMVDYKSDRLTFLIEHGVIRDNGDALELEEVYLQFFEMSSMSTKTSALPVFPTAWTPWTRP